LVFLEEEHFLLQLKFATQPDSSDQPHLNSAMEREIEPAGQFDGSQLAARQPSRVTLTRGLRVKTEFALLVHPPTGNCTETNVSPRALSARNVLAREPRPLCQRGRYLWQLMNNPGRNDPCHCGSGRKKDWFPPRSVWQIPSSG
jgi:hypothetical protein